MVRRFRRPGTKLMLLAGALVTLPFGAAWAQQDALKSQADRVAVVARIKPTVVAIFAQGGQGGGTGVLISDDGFAITNFHVVQPAGPTMQCGLPDGVLYDAVLVGLDKVGDVALIKLLPKEKGQKFPAAALGDSDDVREGDWSIAMGNPFLLATDFTPTITFGMVSGVHRYQYPAGTILEYTDCIQVDTSINPGNSGGPLFNMKGELIGINGRGSFDKRGRVNSGVGYAISINQIKNFLGHLHAGLDADHASLGALVTTQTDKEGLGRVIITSMLEDSDVARRGVELDDELLSFAGRPITSVNHYRNVLGLYPRGWRVPLEYRREQSRKDVLVRLMGVQRRALDEANQPKEEAPKAKGPVVPKGPPSPAAKYFEAKDGFANYYFNKLEQERVMKAFRLHGDFTSVPGNWTLEGMIRLKKLRAESRAKIDITEEKDGMSSKPVIRLKIDDFPYALEPFKKDQEPAALRAPESSGGFLAPCTSTIACSPWARKASMIFLTGGRSRFIHPLSPPTAMRFPPWGRSVSIPRCSTRAMAPFSPSGSSIAAIKSWSPLSCALPRMKIPARFSCPIIASSMAGCCPIACRCNTATGITGRFISPRSISRNNARGGIYEPIKNTLASRER